jgi:hypothetical protein
VHNHCIFRLCPTYRALHPPIVKLKRFLLFRTYFLKAIRSQPSTMQLGDIFDTIQDACEAIKTYVLSCGESFKTVASNKKRYTIVCKDSACSFRIPNTQTQAFNDWLQSSRRYKVYESGNTIYQVEHPNTSIKYIVDLQERTCKCTDVQEYKLPCTHTIAACKYASLDPFKKFSKYHKLQLYQETYS